MIQNVNKSLEKKTWKSPSIIVKSSISRKKIIATIFCKGIIHADYLPHGIKYTYGEYFVENLDAVCLFKQDNVPGRTSHIATDAVKECGFEMLSHPLYLPDLGTGDYHLFPNPKKRLHGKRYGNDNVPMDAVQYWSENKNSDFCRSGIGDVVERRS